MLEKLLPVNCFKNLSLNKTFLITEENPSMTKLFCFYCTNLFVFFFFFNILEWTLRCIPKTYCIKISRSRRIQIIKNIN